MDMISKSIKNLNRRRWSLDLQIPHSRRMEKAAPTHRTKVRGSMDPFRTTIPRCKQRRVMRRRRKKLGSGEFHKIPSYNTDECPSK
jgi:hypothetical protein